MWRLFFFAFFYSKNGNDLIIHLIGYRSDRNILFFSSGLHHHWSLFILSALIMTNQWQRMKTNIIRKRKHSYLMIDIWHFLHQNLKKNLMFGASVSSMYGSPNGKSMQSQILKRYLSVEHPGTEIHLSSIIILDHIHIVRNE